MRRFKAPNREQLMLFPPNLNDWIDDKHPARYALSFVEKADLSAIYATYNQVGDGQPPYEPRMMVAILLYASMVGVYSSRDIERKLNDDIGFRFIAGNLRPDHDTIADFRQKHRKTLQSMFKLSVKVAMRSDLISLAHVAVDGTKVRANASLAKTLPQKQLDELIGKTVGAHFDEACRVDAEEDKKFGKGNNGYMLPDSLASQEALDAWMQQQIDEVLQEEASSSSSSSSNPEPKAPSKKDKKLEKWRKAKAALEEKERKRKEADPTGKRERDATRKRNGKPYVPKINVTDPDCRTMLFAAGQGHQPAYNCQIAVDSDHGLIVSALITQEGNDIRQLAPVLRQTRENTEWLPSNVTADNGYLNFGDIESPEFASVEFYVAARAAMGKDGPDSKMERMRQKLATELGRQIFSKRKAIVEPVFGILKHARKVRQFLMRGREKVEAEWNLICTAHNIWKLHKLGIQIA